MKNTLIIGIAGAGKTRKLKEMLIELPINVRITVCERVIEDSTIRHNDTLNILNEDQQEVAAGFTKMLVQKPSLLVIEELHVLENISVPLGVPVYATMQVETKEEAMRKLSDQDIQIEFDEIIQL